MKKKMKAVVMEGYGSLENLSIESVPIPEPKEDDVLVKIHASSFNPADYALLKGNFGEILSLDSPHILGLDVAGVVVKSYDENDDFKVGDEVYASVNITKHGSFAEYMTVPKDDLAFLPKGLSFEEAAATPLAALTAIQGLYELGNLTKNQSILIRGASGAVGIFAIQLASLKDATIYASCSESSAHLLKDFPVDRIIDYKKDILSECIPEKLDLIYNLAPLDSEKLNELLPLLKEGGTLVSALGLPDIDAKTKKTYILKAEMTKRGGERLKEISSLIEVDKIRPIVTSTWALDEVHELFKAYENHKLLGKAVIVVIESTK